MQPAHGKYSDSRIRRQVARTRAFASSESPSSAATISTDVGRAREGQREASLNRIGAIIPPWRGVPDATSVDRKSRSLGRFTGNSPCSRTAILAWPSQLTGPTRASRRTLVRAPPSAKRSRGLLSRDPLLLAPSLVTSAATAYAPSGWVLW